MKVKHGKSQEITGELSEHAVPVFAQWIGCITVIYNQKTVQSTDGYTEWLTTSANLTIKPIANRQIPIMMLRFSLNSSLHSENKQQINENFITEC